MKHPLSITDKINENNLLNFYLSSITDKNFNFKPNKNTKKEIWQYLNASNLIKLEDATDKERLNELELAANENQINKSLYTCAAFSLSKASTGTHSTALISAVQHLV